MVEHSERENKRMSKRNLCLEHSDRERESKNEYEKSLS